MNLAICVATMRQPPFKSFPYEPINFNGGPFTPGDIPLAEQNAVTAPCVWVQYNTLEINHGVVGSYQRLYEVTTADVLMFMHDDVIVREKGWDERVLREFDDPTVGVVGFGGAKWHGVPDLYKVPYKLQNLRRGDYLSNVDDAEVHGSRFTDSTEVAVLDGYAIAVRRSLLDRIGGWRSFRCDFFCYDYSICAAARRCGYSIRVVGVRCHHRGGGTSVSGVNGITSQEAYDESHRWFYHEFKDVMPCSIG